MLSLKKRLECIFVEAEIITDDFYAKIPNRGIGKIKSEISLHASFYSSQGKWCLQLFARADAITVSKGYLPSEFLTTRQRREMVEKALKEAGYLESGGEWIRRQNPQLPTC